MALIYKDRQMGLFDYDRAKKAYDQPVKGNINEMMSASHFTKFDEFKISDHRNSFELKRIAEALEEIKDILERNNG